MGGPGNPAGERLTGVRVAQYEIGELIGFGGMGEVYKAYDSKLDRTVAIKCPLPGAVNSEVAAERLTREARKACKVTHPNLAAIHDVLEHDHRPLLVMEFVEGQDLAVELRKGALDADRLLDYVSQITDALAAIHDAGLVHRDLKPSNVVVTEGGRIKVLDFGLAASVIAAQSEPAGGDDTTQNFSNALFRRAGTVPYMSPEQLSGAMIDQRSDLFALGVMLHEMLTGKHPFLRPTTEGTISSILHDPPGYGDGKGPVSRTTPLGSVARRLLQKKPEDRYPSAQALARDLRDIARGAIPRDHAGRSEVARPAVTIGIVAALLIALGLIWSHRPVPETPGRPAVAVLPIEDRTGEDRGRAAMIAGLIEAHLGESSDTRAVPAQRVAEIRAGIGGGSLRRMLRKIARGVDTPWLLSGELYFEDAYVGTFDLHNASTGVSRPFSITSASAAEVASGAARRVREMIGGEEVQPTVLLAASDSDEAQALYERARQAFRDLDYAHARGLLDRSLELDERFIAARLLLAEVLRAIGYRDQARAEADETTILVGAKGLAPDSPTALRAEATRARLANDSAGAADAYEKLLERYPDDVVAAISLASIYRSQGRKADALSLIDDALEFDRLDPQAHLERARALIDLGRFDEAESSIRQAERIVTAFDVPGGAGTIAETFGLLEFRRNDLIASRSYYERSAAEHEKDGLEIPAAASRKSVADVQILLWELDPAIAAIEEIIPTLEDAGHLEFVAKSLVSLGAALYRAGELDAAENTLNRAVALARELDQIGIEHSALISLSGTLNNANRLEAAQPSILRSLSIARTLGSAMREGHSLLKLADWHRLGGDADTARATLQPLLAEDSADRVGLGLRLSALQIWTRTASDLERPGEAVSAADEAVRIAEELGRAGRLSYTLSLRGRALALVGDDGADADLDRAEGLLEEVTRTPTLEGVLRLGRAQSFAGRGDWGKVLEQSSDGSMSSSRLDLLVMRAQALYELGRAADALAVLAPSDTRLPRNLAARAGWTRARCHEALGEIEQARAVAVEASNLAAETKQLLTRAELSVMLSRISEEAPARASWLAEARTCLGEFLGFLSPAQREALFAAGLSPRLARLLAVDDQR